MMFDTIGRWPRQSYNSSLPFPYRQPRAPCGPQQLEQPNYEVEPLISSSSTLQCHTIKLEAPCGTRLSDTSARIDGDSILLRGRVLLPETLNRYILRSRAGLYSHPSRHHLLGVLPAGTELEGKDPQSSGWLHLDDGSWVLDDGSLALLERGHQPRLIRFAKRVEIPKDANIDATTVDSDKDGQQLLIYLPRIKLAKQSAPGSILPTEEAPGLGISQSGKPSSENKTRAPVAGKRPSGSIAKCTMQQIINWQTESMADDVPIFDHMTNWNEDQVRAFFESGGADVPLGWEHLHGNSAQPKAKGSPSSPPAQKPRLAEHEKVAGTPSLAISSLDALRTSEPILTETGLLSAAHVQHPSETCQCWEAVPGGGFVPTFG